MDDPGSVSVRLEIPTSPDALGLVALLDAELAARYPENPYPPPELGLFVAPTGALVVVRSDDVPAACGGFVHLEVGVGEVKRMFVAEAFRGREYARRVLTALEGAAPGLGFDRLRLETGLRQPEAIQLYRSSGFVEIPRYGVYTDDPMSVCFEKRVATARASL